MSRSRSVTPALDPVWTRTEPIEFCVEGEPASKGSIRAFVKPGMKFPVLTSTNKHLKPWEKTVRVTAKLACADQLFLGPVAVWLQFRLPRPLALKGADVWHDKRPDLDKYVRAVLDALTGTCYQDDGQVVAITATKRYGNLGCRVGVMVRLEQAGGEYQPEMF